MPFTPNGTLASTDEGNASVMDPHVANVYSNHRLVDWNIILGIDKRDTVPGIDHPIEWDEIKSAITKLAN